MWYTVTLDGIPLGVVELIGAPRAIGTLLPTPAFASTGIRRRALSLGISLRLLGSGLVGGAVVARRLAAAIASLATIQDRLGLFDEDQRAVGIIHLVLVQFPRTATAVVVAQLREQASPVMATPHPLRRVPGDESRSAA